MEIPNYYIEKLITDRIKRLANKVKAEYAPSDEGNTMINKNFLNNMLKWTVTLTFQNKSQTFVYVIPEGHGNTPRTEYVLCTIFANARLYNVYKGKQDDFYIHFRPMFTNFRAAIEYLDELEKGYKEMKVLFGDSYELYESSFTSFSPLFQILK